MAKFELEYIFIEGTVAFWGSFESVFIFFKGTYTQLKAIYHSFLWSN